MKTVCVIDVPDVEGWLFGGEFLLSSGYIFKDDPEMLAHVIETADKHNAAALGIKLERYIDRVPQSVLRTADKLSFPLIGIPAHYAHTDIINPVLVTMAEKTIETMNLSNDVRREFFNILLSDVGIDSILALLNKYISRELLFVDMVTGERFVHTASLSFSQLADNIPVASLIGHFPNYKIVLNEKIRGYLFMDRPINESLHGLVLEHAKNALLISLKFEHERWKLIKGRETQLAQDIIYKRFRRDSEILSRGRTLGWNLSGGKAVAVVGVSVSRSSPQEPSEPYVRAFELIRLKIEEIQGKTPYTPLERETAFILNASGDTWNTMKEKIKEAFASAFRVIHSQTGLCPVMGVGTPAENILSCNKSFREASKALALAQESGCVDRPIFWEDVGAYKVLAQIYNSQEAAGFIDEYLGELIKIGDKESDSLIHTLSCLIKSNWQLRSAAEKLNCHYNTAKYRYRKIGDAIGKDLENPAVRLNVSFAMELYKLNKIKKENAIWED